MLEQGAEVGVAHRGDQLAQVGLHLLWLTCGTVQQILGRITSGFCRGKQAKVYLWSEPWMDRVAAPNTHRATRWRETLGLDEVLPHHCDHRASAVAELQAQIVAAVAA